MQMQTNRADDALRARAIALAESGHFDTVHAVRTALMLGETHLAPELLTEPKLTITSTTHDMARERWPVKMLLTVHDELVFEAPPAIAPDAAVRRRGGVVRARGLGSGQRCERAVSAHRDGGVHRSG